MQILRSDPHQILFNFENKQTKVNSTFPGDSHHIILFHFIVKIIIVKMVCIRKYLLFLLNCVNLRLGFEARSQRSLRFNIFICFCCCCCSFVFAFLLLQLFSPDISRTYMHILNSRLLLLLFQFCFGARCAYMFYSFCLTHVIFFFRIRVQFFFIIIVCCVYVALVFFIHFCVIVLCLCLCVPFHISFVFIMHL